MSTTATTTRRQQAAAAQAAKLTSPIVAALEQTWAAIVRRHPELPPTVAIVVSSGTTGASKMATRGHFAPRRWSADGTEVHEVFVSGERLADGAEAVLATLLHEAAHALAHVREIADTSRGGRYHNDRYRKLATELGLNVAKVGTIGWSDTTLADGTAASYAAVLTKLAAALAAYRRAEVKGTGRKSSNNGLVLECMCGRKIRVSRKVAAMGPIDCGVCGLPFLADNDADTDDED